MPVTVFCKELSEEEEEEEEEEEKKRKGRKRAREWRKGRKGNKKGEPNMAGTFSDGVGDGWSKVVCHSCIGLQGMDGGIRRRM